MKFLIHLENNTYLETLFFAENPSYANDILQYDILLSSTVSKSWLEHIEKTSGLLWVYEPEDKRFLLCNDNIEDFFSGEKIRENVINIAKNLEEKRSIASYQDFLSLPLEKRGASLVTKNYSQALMKEYSKKAKNEELVLVWQFNQLQIVLPGERIMPFVIYAALNYEPLNLQEYSKYITFEDAQSLYLLQKHSTVSYPEFLHNSIKTFSEHDLLNNIIKDNTQLLKKYKI